MLGPVEVWTGQDWAKIGAGKQRSVLATLLLRPGEVVSTDALIDQVWPDKPPARAANLISVYVYHLRKLIGDADGQVIVTRAPGYQLMLAPGIWMRTGSPRWPPTAAGHSRTVRRSWRSGCSMRRWGYGAGLRWPMCRSLSC